jgi:hypothetical protein
MPSMTMHTGYGPMPFAAWVILRAKLKSLAYDEWEREVRPSLPWLSRVLHLGREQFVSEHVSAWLNHGNCPYVTVKPGLDADTLTFE